MRISGVVLSSSFLFLLSACVELSQDPQPQPIRFKQETQSVLERYKPALAVRGISCMLCHARIHSSVITDFGYGDPQFFEESRPGSIYGESSVRSDSKPLTLPWYGNYYGTWQLADEINGTIIVPKVTLSDFNFLASLPGWTGETLSLVELFSLDLGDDYYGRSNGPGTGPMHKAVNPTSPNPKVAEIDEIYIGAPTVQELEGHLKTLPASATGWEAVDANSSLTGLKVEDQGFGSYLTNAGSTLTCKGDIIIQGTLFLDQVTIATGAAGCRLMVTGAVFVQGQIQFASRVSTENLQISSATAILMGFSVSSLTTRLSHWYPDAQPLTRGQGTNSEKNGRILAQARMIGSRLHDSNDAANCPTEMVTYTAYNGGSSTQLTQCKVDYDRLLLNAPNIQSRYIGHFRGVVIAEIGLFAPGELDFSYDPVFNDVPLLPVITPVLDLPECETPGCGGWTPIGV